MPSLPEIVLAAATYRLTRTLSINRDVTLTADRQSETVLDGGHQVRVLQVYGTGVQVVLQNLTIQHGYSSPAKLQTGAGAGIYVWCGQPPDGTTL